MDSLSLVSLLSLSSHSPVFLSLSLVSCWLFYFPFQACFGDTLYISSLLASNSSAQKYDAGIHPSSLAPNSSIYKIKSELTRGIEISNFLNFNFGLSLSSINIQQAGLSIYLYVNHPPRLVGGLSRDCEQQSRLKSRHPIPLHITE